MAPPWMRSIVSLYIALWWRCRPTPTLRFFSFAALAALRTRRTPGASTATGFSMKTCLPCSTAYSKCSGRKPGGVAWTTTSTPESITLR